MRRTGMALLFPSIIHPVLLFLLLSSCHHKIHAAGDTLKPGDSVSINQTIVSSGEIFALGFFNPGKSPTSYYLGIWYNAADKAVVWVANRENPLTDTSGVLTLDGDGNLVIWNGNRSKIWSSNSSEASNGTEAVLLDSGNLVLRLRGNDIWQSFDHPTDTLLPNMKLTSHFRTGVTPRYVSWRAAGDPSPGNFSFGLDPRTSMQLFIWRGSETYWRSHVWNGTAIYAAPVDNENSTSIYVETNSVDDEEISIWYTVTQDSAVTREVMTETGLFVLSTWEAASGSWVKQASLPTNTSKSCELYNQCGSNGVCDGYQTTTLLCKCFAGFVPKSSTHWDAGNYSAGCVRKAAWDCNKGGYFVAYKRMKLPDEMILIRDASEKECEANCSATCSCTAYSFAYTRSPGNNTRCLVWFGEMIDLVQNWAATNELYVRVTASDLDNNSQNEASSKKLIHLLVIILPAGAIVILLLGTTCYFLRMRHNRLHKSFRKCKQNVIGMGELRTPDNIGSDRGIIDVPLVDFFTILNATDDFAITNKLGEGGFGCVYKGKLQHGQEIAVKRLSKNSRQGFDELKNEVELIAKLQHTNLVKLLGWCIHEDEKILIYEYLPNKSLDKYLFVSDQSIKLDWDKRFQIIEGIAQGLLYLHRYSRLRVIHRDLKTSNILLDDNMNPKISDFGLARIFAGNQKEAKTERVVGTYGYMSPEYALNGHFSEKSDVFSFGVILLEIISGKRNTGSYLYNGSFSLLGYAWQLWDEERCCELADPSMNCSFPVVEVVKCIQVGLLCVQDRLNDRPTMDSIVYMLGNKNPALPSPQQPAFTSSSPASEEPSYELTMSTFEGR